jgi:hypothetical protein
MLPSEDLGLHPQQKGQINFTFRADPALTEAFKRYFDWLWANSQEITAKGVALIPDLLPPEGTEEGARQVLVFRIRPAATALTTRVTRMTPAFMRHFVKRQRTDSETGDPPRDPPSLVATRPPCRATRRFY